MSWVGTEVTQVVFDYAVTLRTSDGSELRIESEFSLRLADGSSLKIKPPQVGDAARLLVQLFGRHVRCSDVIEDGVLFITFDSGVGLRILPSSVYEAWTFVGGDGRRLVANPAGGLTEWDQNT